MRALSIILIAISIVGAIGLPLGDPKFLAFAIALESSYIALAALSFKIDVKYITLASIALAALVIIGNTLSRQHVDIILNLNPIENAIILIIGGYILQVLLILASIRSYKSKVVRDLKHEQ